MANLDWAIVCDLAFFDRHDRLCVMGIARRLLFPRLPVSVRQLMIVARLQDIDPVDEIAITLGVMTPNGDIATPASAEGLSLEVSGEYVLATLRDIPFFEEGNYGFSISLRDQPPLTIDVSVMTLRHAASADVH